MLAIPGIGMKPKPDKFEYVLLGLFALAFLALVVAAGAVFFGLGK